MVKRVVGLLALQVLVGVSARESCARVVLKPNGRDAIPLRVKSLAADVKIRGQFASTTNVVTFANETSQRIEADFIYTVPEGTVVTYFAYWFGEEKVVARIVEKERAAAIYGHITSRMRDPALVEMIGRNTFRARIFPVMPNADLKVEMRWAQPLQATPTGLKYTFPLAPDEPGTGILDELNLQVDVEPDASGTPIARASNSYGQPISRANGHLKTQLKQTAFQPDKDFELKLDHRAAGSPAPALRALAFAAPSGGRDGFFALALTVNRDIARPQLKIRGLRTYDISPRILPAMKAGQSSIVCGRYSGNGTATVELAGLGSANVQFGSQAENDNLATRLWAARRIEEMGASEKNREAALKLSHQFTLPSKWSSWLAVPAEELERFKQEKLAAELQVLGRRYALEVAQNGVKSRRARALKQQFEAMRAQASYGGSAEDFLPALASELLRLRAEESVKERPNQKLMAQLQRQIDALNKLSEERIRRQQASDERQQIISAREQFISAQIDALSRELVQQETRGRARRAGQLRAQLRSVAKKSSYGQQWEPYYQTLRSQKSRQLAFDYVRARYEKGDARATRLASQQLANLSGRQNAQKSIKDVRLEWANERVYKFATLLAEEKGQEQPSTRRVAELEAQIARAEKQAEASLRESRESAQSRWVYTKLPALAQELVQEKYAQSPDAARIASIQARISRVARAAPNEEPARFESSPLLDLMRESQRQYVQELANAQPDRALLQVLEGRMARLYADPKYFGVIVNENTVAKSQNPLRLPKIAELKRDVADLDAQLQAQPDAAQKEVLAQSKREKVARLAYATRYHLRLGDPLIAIDAPRDARQVVAVMPDGQVKRLLWIESAKRWEARFDIPAYASEGAYRIVVIVVEKSGERRERTVNFSVDMTPPRGKGQAETVAQPGSQPTLRLEISGDKDTARVFALLPWGEKAELKLSPVSQSRFFALAPIPQGQQAPAQVTYILTDRAHNRTTITVDVSR